MAKSRYRRQCKKRKKRIIPRRKRRNKSKQSKRNQRPIRVGGPTNRHHCCYQKQFWTRGHAKAVRNFWYCIIPLNVNFHRGIHANITSIPVPDEQTAKTVYYNLIALEKSGALKEEDTFEQRILLIAALFDDDAPATAQALRKQLEV